MSTFYSNGKLLISGEYLVLDKAIALALPSKYGQTLEVLPFNKNQIDWSSYSIENKEWFSVSFDVESLTILNSTNTKIATTLQDILSVAKHLNPSFLIGDKGFKVKTKLTFPNEWGLGTSSTLIHNIALWANINPFELLEKSFGGSGYDIACAANHKPITYQRNGVDPNIKVVDFNPPFTDDLHFVYLNIKQDSKEGIKMYRSLNIDKTSYFKQINHITQQMIQADTLQKFEELVEDHELLVRDLIGLTPVKQRLFKDYEGSIKSLGAWGGDFVLVTGKTNDVKKYFESKGFLTILSYQEMILT